MITQLYEPFKKWSENGSVYIISDPHFNDIDTKFMNPNWITAEEHIAIINNKVKANDTLICLGDCGDLEYFNKIKSRYKVLIKGNHDDKGNSRYSPYFNEIYSGPLFIAPKIVLSHEPIYDLNFAINIHGHCHNAASIVSEDGLRYNLASDVIDFTVFNLGAEIKKGLVSNITDIHRLAIEKQKEKSNAK